MIAMTAIRIMTIGNITNEHIIFPIPHASFAAAHNSSANTASINITNIAVNMNIYLLFYTVPGQSGKS